MFIGEFWCDFDKKLCNFTDLVSSNLKQVFFPVVNILDEALIFATYHHVIWTATTGQNRSNEMGFELSLFSRR